MKLRALVVATAALVVPHKAEAHVHGCHTSACDKRVHHHRAIHWLHRHPLRYAESTAYCPGSSGTVTADGSTVHIGVVAMNTLPLETRIRFDRTVMGRHYFRVQDRIGWGSQLDVWMPSCVAAVGWGRRSVAYRVIP